MKNTDCEKKFAIHITIINWYPKYTKIFVMLQIEGKCQNNTLKKQENI